MTMQDDVNRIFHEACDGMERAIQNVKLADIPPIDVRKTHAQIFVSDELLMDAGVIPDTRPRVRIPWHRRLRWRFREWRERVGRKVGGWIAGVDLSERDDW